MGRDTGQAVEPAKLVAPMLAKFMAADRAFAKARRTTASAKTLSQAERDYPSVRDPDGECAGLFYPDCVRNPVQGRHLDYHWDGARVDLYRDASSSELFRVG